MIRRQSHPSVALSLIIVLVGAALLFGAAGAYATFTGSAQFEGRLVDVHSDDFEHGTASHQYRLETDQGTFELRFADRSPELPRASRVAVQGQRSGSTITVAAGGVRAASGSTTSSAATTGAKKIAIILFTFTDNNVQPYTPAYAQGVAFTNANSVAAYYTEASWGQLILSGDVFGWYQLHDTSASCNYSAWAAEGDAAAKAGGANLASYDHFVYAFPKVQSCAFGGLSYMPGTQSWLNGSSGMSLHVMAHELGHNFGTHHANSYSCTDNGIRVSLSASASNCTSTEYGDGTTVMGGLTSRRLQTNFARGNLGWLSAPSTLDVATSGTYTLNPVESFDATGVQALRITRNASTYFLLEFRQPYGSYFDNYLSVDAAVNGVTIRITPGYSTLTQSLLIDATPETWSFADAQLAVGKTFVDPLSGISITTVAVASLDARVLISFGAGGPSPTPSATQTATPTPMATPSATATPSPDTQPPTVPGDLAAILGKGRKVGLSWGASSDDVGVAGYRVYRDGVLLTTTTSTIFTDSLAGRSRTTTYFVVTYDAAGNVSPPSNAISVTS
jgi:hypothetical protein